MNKKENILFIVPDGVGIRNYVYSSIITHLKHKVHLYFWTTLSDLAINEVEKLHEIEINHSQFTLLKESFKTRICRESSTYARLKLFSKKLQNDTILGNWKKNNQGLKLKAYYCVAKFIGKIASKKYSWIINLEKQSQKYWDRKIIDHFKNQLAQINPKSIFITHQRVAYLNPICIAANELNISIVSCIYSWDNVSKASLAIRADKYLVWSDYMKEELSFLYPEIHQDNIVVTGTPQFEFYFQEKRKKPREVFAKHYGLDPNKKWICYSGDDEKTSPYDPQYLEDVARAIKEIPLDNRPEIIFRRCPVDTSDRFDEVLNKYSEFIHVLDPIWNVKEDNWGAVYPKLEDIDMLVNVAFHCELVINVGSTMSHDFAVYNKPCFYLRYDQVKDKNWSVNTIYKYQHFRSMGNLEAVEWLTDANEIKEKISLALTGTKEIAKDKQEWMRKIVRHPLQENAKIIANQLINA